MRLSELNQQIESVVENNFIDSNLWVIADITNHSFKEKTNYHYFDLVEKSEKSNELIAKISGKAWGTGASKIRDFERITGQRFSNNINVLIRVKVNYHVVFGLSLDIQDIDTGFYMTIGAGIQPSVALASAQDVDRITIESRDTGETERLRCWPTRRWLKRCLRDRSRIGIRSVAPR